MDGGRFVFMFPAFLRNPCGIGVRYKNSCKAGLWEMGNGDFHVDKSFRIDCVGEVKTPKYPIFPRKDI